MAWTHGEPHYFCQEFIILFQQNKYIAACTGPKQFSAPPHSSEEEESFILALAHHYFPLSFLAAFSHLFSAKKSAFAISPSALWKPKKFAEQWKLTFKYVYWLYSSFYCALSCDVKHAINDSLRYEWFNIFLQPIRFWTSYWLI